MVTPPPPGALVEPHLPGPPLVTISPLFLPSPFQILFYGPLNIDSFGPVPIVLSALQVGLAVIHSGGFNYK